MDCLRRLSVTLLVTVLTLGSIAHAAGAATRVPSIQRLTAMRAGETVTLVVRTRLASTCRIASTPANRALDRRIHCNSVVHASVPSGETVVLLASGRGGTARGRIQLPAETVSTTAVTADPSSAGPGGANSSSVSTTVPTASTSPTTDVAGDGGTPSPPPASAAVGSAAPTASAPTASRLQISGGLPNAQVGTQYFSWLQVTGGTGPYSWSLVGDLPFGLVLTSDGSVTGIPSVVGSFSFAVRVTSADGTTATSAVTLEVV